MKIFSTVQIKKWDAFTIKKEPITSIKLMERAAAACYDWLKKCCAPDKQFIIFCGKGNNGGDGLAIARLLIKNNYKAVVYIVDSEQQGSDDFNTNLEKLYLRSREIFIMTAAGQFPVIEKNNIIVDAIFGTGLNKPPKGLSKALIQHINKSTADKISIDLPSGLFADSCSAGNAVVNATHTLSLQNYKLAFLLPENEMYCGNIHLLPIGLLRSFEKDETTKFEMIDIELIRHIYKPRLKFAHKGKYGHAALVCGSLGMIGAAVLSSKACLRAGTGKLTSYIPKCGYEIIQTAVPESMAVVSGRNYPFSTPDIEKFNAVGIGPGIGLAPSLKKMLAEVFQKNKNPMVIDADALNLLAKYKRLLNSIPSHSILTPHPKEFDKLFGKTANDFERLELAMRKSKEHNIVIILKGHYSFIGSPAGGGFFNSTGNPGMATAGSGDVLTGIITGMLAQGYSALESAKLGVYIHGLAGDYAAAKFSEEAMVAGDIISSLGGAFKFISKESL